MVQIFIEKLLSAHFEVVVNSLLELLNLVGLVCFDPVFLGFDVLFALLSVYLVEALLHLTER